MTRIMPMVGLLALVSAAVLSGCGEKGDAAAVVREEPSLAGIRIGEVIDLDDAAVLKARGLTRNGQSLRPSKGLRLNHCMATPPSDEYEDVYVTLSTNNVVVEVNCFVNCAPGETPEQLKARCLEHYKDRISADGPYHLVLEITDNFKTPPAAKPSLGLLISLYNRAFSPLAQE